MTQIKRSMKSKVSRNKQSLSGHEFTKQITGSSRDIKTRVYAGKIEGYTNDDENFFR